ncbi:hypothetical protein LNAOJCKE_5541 [Methylorubrum aminovorans]|uniref:Uncharacterized protein n=1 Tax=Methylorubrum aminovorans TaxID=269069 RepID=A0ABQ4UM17_9HYPH|nr:hypothetical protein [Methylorubrum aminovorans]GJE68304.1 hypothetical protein LNAOJCKE_5541 [Methylorubrum aminovorans]GMA75616.1 hypothetical protein GCM10025880_20330 [Methylorubrum aminovorans]
MCATHSSALDTASIGERLAWARLTGELADVDLAGLADLDAAEEVRDAALLRLGWTQVGYALVGTHPAVARTLCLDVPVVAPLMRETIREGSSPLRMPHGPARRGRRPRLPARSFSFPISDDEPLTARNASQACLTCGVDLQVLGRRTLLPALLDESSAIADPFAAVASLASRLAERGSRPQACGSAGRPQGAPHTLLGDRAPTDA